MIRPTPEMETAYRQVAEAVDALDSDDLRDQVARLTAALSSGPDEVIEGACTSLIDLWVRTDQIWPNEASTTTDQRRQLIGEALTALDRSFPRLTVHTRLDQAALALQETERLRLEQLLTTSPEGAARRALQVAGRFENTVVDALGEVVVRALLIEGGRLERLGRTPPAELAATLRRATQHPAWLPEGMTRADLAVVVAMMDYFRDDYSLLDETLDEAEGGPFGEPSSEGYLAVLRAAAAIGRLDVVEAERLLRQAAGPVAASGDSALITAYRGICDMAARTRNQRISDPLGELARLMPSGIDETENADVALILDAHEQIARLRISDEIKARLAAWRDADPAKSSIANQALLWGICALVALTDSHPKDAHLFAGRCQEARSQLPTGGMQAAFIDQLLVTFEGTSALRGADPHRATASFASRLEELGPESKSVLSTITESQQTVIYFAANRYPEALRSGLRALTARRRISAALPGSSERAAMMGMIEPLYETVVKSAARIGDVHLMAELLEFLRAQDLPIAHRAPGSAELPLAHAVPPATGEQIFLRSTNPLIDVIESPEPDPVLMPWGSVALVSILGEHNGTPAKVVVPR